MSDFDPIERAAAELASASEDHDFNTLQHDADLKWLIAEYRGRRFLRRLLNRAGVLQTSFSGDALTAAFREGERSIGLFVLQDVARVAPASFGELLFEDANGRPD